MCTLTDDLLETVKNSQRKDGHCEAIRECIMVKGTYKDFQMRRDILYKVVEGSYLLAVPKCMESQVIRAAHEKGHVNARRVEAEVRKDYYIDGLAKKCEKILAQCVPCILAARKAGKQEGLLHPIPKEDEKLQILTCGCRRFHQICIASPG